MNSSDPRIKGNHKLPKDGVYGCGGGKGEKHMVPDKPVIRDMKPQRKAPTWKTGKTG